MKENNKLYIRYSLFIWYANQRIYESTNHKHMTKNILYFVLGIVALSIASCATPTAAFRTTNLDQPAPIAKVGFENDSKNATEYLWDFGDGTTSTAAVPKKHKYTKAGEYTVTLKAVKGKKEQITSKVITVKEPKNCTLELQTDYGNMTILLYDSTPQHRDNFLKLVSENFYDDLLFHRVIQGFMIQGGDPDSRGARAGQRLGMGGPGYTIPAEFDVENIHLKGALSAARTGGPSNPQKRSSGSQFYIVQGNPQSDSELDMMEMRTGYKYPEKQREAYKEVGGTPFLDRDYTVFGIVTEGLDVIDKIAALKTQPGDRPVEDVKMKIVVKNMDVQ